MKFKAKMNCTHEDTTSVSIGFDIEADNEHLAKEAANAFCELLTCGVIEYSIEVTSEGAGFKHFETGCDGFHTAANFCGDKHCYLGS